MLPDNLREFGDMTTARNWLNTATLDALTKRFPIEDDEYKLDLINPHYDKPRKYTLTEQKQALLKQQRLNLPVRGTWQLTHKPTGQVLDQREDTILQVPYLTDRGTFIHGGNEYSGVSQARLKPGVYTRKTNAGINEAFFNIESGKGKNFRINVDPATGVFKVNVGQANIPLYPLVRAMGVEDKDLINAWGPSILESNILEKGEASIDKLYARFAGRKADPNANMQAKINYLKETLPTYKVNKEVMARTLGLEGVEGITPEVLLSATRKLIAIGRKEIEPDDRDSPVYTNTYSYEDLIPERIEKDAGNLSKTLFHKVKRDKTLKRVAFSALNPYIENYMFGSRLIMPLEETNPMHLLEQMHRITKLGEGGIGSSSAVTEAARNVNPGQLGFIDPVAGPESEAAGVDARIAYKTFKGKDRNMYAEFNDVKTGKQVYLRPDQVDGYTVAFPGELKSKGLGATVIKNGKITTVSKKNVDYEVPTFAHMFSHGVNLAMAPTGIMPTRSFYMSKYWSQYMPLVKGEVPLVAPLMSDNLDMTFNEYYGRKIGSLSAPQAGVIKKVTSDEITLISDEGETIKQDLVKDFPFNRLTGLSYFPSVKAGDKVNAGDMIAHSNFTDSKTGSLNMGVNLKVAVIPAKGKSYEDAWVMSESAAKKLATERLFGYDEEGRHGTEINKNRFIALFPREFTKEQMEKIGDDGVVKQGTILQKGDPIITATGPKLLSPEDIKLGKLHSALRNAFTNKTTVWDNDYPGYVVDSLTAGKKAIVNVKAQVPVRVGDKLTTLNSLKGVVGEIKRDDLMPQDQVTGEPYHILLNPMGILSRVAPNQLVELQLAKIAKKTNTQMRIPQDAPEGGWVTWTLNELHKRGLQEATNIFDPETTRTIKNITDGYVYIAPFHHLAEKKLSDRGGGAGGYSTEMQPVHGGQESGQAKKFGGMDMTAALSHGATNVIRDVITIRGNKDEDYWKALKLGQQLPEPKVPFVYDKFINLLKAGGVNINEKGNITKLLPMTDKDIDGISKGALTASGSVDYNFEPVPGGLFDMGKTGGIAGNQWSHIPLNELMPNPVFEEPIRRLLGLTVNDLYDVIGGNKQINGQTGGAAIKNALSGIDIAAELNKHKELVKTTRGSVRDNSVKIIGYLSALQQQNLTPDNWVLSKIPVLPPIFRPVLQMGDVTIQADLNELYRDVMETNKQIKEMRKDLPEAGVGQEKTNLYDSVKAVFGLGYPITQEGKSKGLKGAIWQITGNTAKHGLFQNKVISKPVDVVGRGVAIPDPNLDMDQIGIPDESAWTIYAPFVMRRLVRRGYPPERVIELIKARSKDAEAALDEEMSERPVIVDRAPVWHKFNLLAFKPVRNKENVIRTSPLINIGFNLDFDGDTMNFHVPVSDKAVEDANEKMLPSKNLTSLTDLRSVRHPPSREMAMGLYMLTKSISKTPTKIFKTVEDAKKAYKQGLIQANDPIEILKPS